MSAECRMEKDRGAVRNLKFSFCAHPLLWLTIVGLAIRLALGALLTYNFDVSHWAQVIQNIRSGNGLYELDGYYYTPPWGYMLAFISSIGDFVGVGELGERVLEALPVESYGRFFSGTLTTISFNVLVKIPMFLCDIAVAYLIRWIVLRNTGDVKKSNYAYILWFLCPLVMIICSVNGMFDTFSVLLVLLCMVFVMQDRCFLAGAFLCLAALVKVFPIFFVFVLVAYVMIKHKDDNLVLKKVSFAALGAAVMFIVVMLPNIMYGNVAETFGFLTNRAGSGVGLGLGAIESYGTLIAYASFLILSVLISIRFYKSGTGGNLDHRLMFMLFLNVTVLFLYPSTPQYILLLLPFLIYHLVVCDRRYIIQWILFAIGSSIFALYTNCMLLLSVGEFTGLISVEGLMSSIDSIQTMMIAGINMTDALYYSGGIIQYFATISILFFMYRERKESKTRAVIAPI